MNAPAAAPAQAGRAHLVSVVDGGAEKMVYDLRSGPQVLEHNGGLYAAMLLHDDEAVPHPHVMMRPAGSSAWSRPRRLATMPRYDHHFAPVLWFDHDSRLHVLCGCHGHLGIGGGPGLHLVASDPDSIEHFEPGPDVATSISYPRIVRMDSGRLLCWYRHLGHMGSWGYVYSDDGGYTWTRRRTFIDFDQDPQRDDDLWAGTYHSVLPDADGHRLHLGFVLMDERKSADKTVSPLIRNAHRHHLYYAVLDTRDGSLRDVAGNVLATPVNRAAAESLKVWDTGPHYTNVPALAVDDQGQAVMLLTATESADHFDAAFYCVRRRHGQWLRHRLCATNSTWNGCSIRRTAQGLTADLIVAADAGRRMYGGGRLQRWSSTDGENWHLESELDTDPGLLLNNPKPIECSNRSLSDADLVCFGWSGRDSLQPVAGKHREPPAVTGTLFIKQAGIKS